MKSLIDTDKVLTFHVTEEEGAEFAEKKMTVGEILDEFSDEGCPAPERAIPISWIENETSTFAERKEDFSDLVALHIKSMIMKWKIEQGIID